MKGGLNALRRNPLQEPGGYREWEKNKKIYIFGIDVIKPDTVNETIGIISDVIEEFNLPLRALNGNKTKIKDVPIVRNLISNNTQEKFIDFSSMERELEKNPLYKGLLPYGLIILVNPEKYEFKKFPGDEEPAIYGCGSPVGLIVLRKFSKNAVRHEFGHMIGLGSHHNNCVMHYSCSIEKFCDKCREKIEKIWG